MTVHGRGKIFSRTRYFRLNSSHLTGLAGLDLQRRVMNAVRTHSTLRNAAAMGNCLAHMTELEL